MQAQNVVQRYAALLEITTSPSSLNKLSHTRLHTVAGDDTQRRRCVVIRDASIIGAGVCASLRRM